MSDYTDKNKQFEQEEYELHLERFSKCLIEMLEKYKDRICLDSKKEG